MQTNQEKDSVISCKQHPILSMSVTELQQAKHIAVYLVIPKPRWPVQKQVMRVN